MSDFYRTLLTKDIDNSEIYMLTADLVRRLGVGWTLEEIVESEIKKQEELKRNPRVKDVKTLEYPN